MVEASDAEQILAVLLSRWRANKLVRHDVLPKVSRHSILYFHN